MLKISEVEEVFREIFEEEEGKVSSVDTVYEKSKDGDFYKLVLSVHNLITEDILIIHTKFIFRVDLQKRNLISDSFIYLYDINCVYHKRNFSNIIDLRSTIEDIINSRDFGQDLVILSDFIEAPAMFLNYYMKRENITDYSIFDVEYDPKFRTHPCHKMTFDFEININNQYVVSLSIKKLDRSEEETFDTYIFYFKFLDEHKTVKNDTLRNIHYFIGSNVAKILDEKLKG